LRDPANTPAGLTLFSDTARSGPVTYQPGAPELVGLDAAEFVLVGALDASVLAVDETQVAEVARQTFDRDVPDGTTLLPETVAIAIEASSTDRTTIAYDATAGGQGYRVVDGAAIAEQIAGLPISEAQAILGPLGATTVTVWPDFVGDLPGDPSRITLDVREPSTTE
jgi:hypothetical protein